MKLSMKKKMELYRIFMMVWAVPRWFFVQIFRWPFYEGKYLKGKWFQSILSTGWQWAYEDLLHRIVTQKNMGVPWPVSPYMTCGSKIEFDIEDINNFNGGGVIFKQYLERLSLEKGLGLRRMLALSQQTMTLKIQMSIYQGRILCWGNIAGLG